MPSSREYHRCYSRNYYHVQRDKYISQLGGKCTICGSTEELEFDHIDPASKSFDVGKLLNRSATQVELELQKCQLLCKKCHDEKSRKYMSEMMHGDRNPWYGKHGADHPSSKPVIDLDTGEKYDSATEYANAHDLHPNCIAAVCRGVRKSIHGHHVAYTDE